LVKLAALATDSPDTVKNSELREPLQPDFHSSKPAPLPPGAGGGNDARVGIVDPGGGDSMRAGGRGALGVSTWRRSEHTTRSTRCTVGTPHVIIGTPGRLNGKLQAPGALRLTRVRVLVLDEVDMMLDMG